MKANSRLGAWAFLQAAVVLNCWASFGFEITPSFTPLGRIPEAGGYYSSNAFGISGDGSVVVGYSTAPLATQAFRWTKTTGVVGLGDLPGGNYLSLGFGVSYDGSVIVGRSSSKLSNMGSTGWYEPFRWTAGSGMVGMGFLKPGTGYGTSFDVSANGTVIVGMSTAQPGERAFRWTLGGGMTDIMPPNGSQGGATGVSDDGSIVVGYSSTDTGREPFRWSASTGFELLGLLPGGAFLRGEASGISGDGSTIVGWSYSANGIEAYRWTLSGGLVGLGDLPGGAFGSSALAASENGAVIVGTGYNSFGERATIWDSTHGFQDIQEVLVQYGFGTALAGWQLRRATGVSNDGRTIVGYGDGPNGVEAWVATIPLQVPEPSSLSIAIFGAGLILLFVSKRGSRRGSIVTKSTQYKSVS